MWQFGVVKNCLFLFTFGVRNVYVKMNRFPNKRKSCPHSCCTAKWMRPIDIFFKISNARHCWFTHFVRSVTMKLFCKRANQNKNNFRFTTLTKHVNNQTNCRITLEKMKKIWICLVFIYLYVPLFKITKTIIDEEYTFWQNLKRCALIDKGKNFVILRT